jgi:uncharacterized protein involved in outer membrane biogenesis
MTNSGTILFLILVFFCMDFRMQPAAPTPSEPSSRFSRFRPGPRVRRVLIAVLTLWALWWLFLGLAGPALVRNAATGWAQGIGRSLTIGDVTLHPWNMSLELRQVALKDRDGSPLFSAEAIRLDAVPRALLIGHWRAHLLSLSQPRFNVVRDARGEWNWARLIADASGPASTKKGPAPKILLDLLSLNQGQMTFTDRLAGVDRHYVFDRLNLNLHDLSTLSSEGDYTLSAMLDNRAQLKWRGRLGLSPLSSSGRISLTDLPLPVVWSYLAPYVHLAAPPAGNLSTDLNYVFDMKGVKPHLTLSTIFARVGGLQLRSPDGHDTLAVRQLALEDGIYDLQKESLFFKRLRLTDGSGGVLRDAAGHLNWLDILPPSPGTDKHATGSGFRFQINDLRLENWTLHVEDRGFVRPLLVQTEIPLLSFGIRQNREQGLGIERMMATLKNFGVSTAGQPAPITVGLLQLSGASLTGRQVRLGALTLQQPSVSLQKGADGRLNLASLFTAAPGAAKRAGGGSSGDWKVVLPRFGMSEGQLVWRDDSLARPAGLTLDHVSGDLTPHAADPGFDAVVSASAGSGTIDLKGVLDPSAGRLQGELNARAVPLTSLAPYLLAKTPLTMSSGTASGTLMVSVGGGAGWSLSGQAGVADLSIREPGERAPLLGWRALSLAGLKVSGQPLKVAVHDVVLDRPQARLVLDQNRVSNIRRLFGGAPTSSPAPAPAQRAGAGVNFDVRMIHVRHANVDFADLGMNPAFSARINNLGGTVSGLSSRPGKRGAIALNGAVDQAGDVRVRGALAPLAVTDNADISLMFRNISLSSLNTYSENIAGWEIDGGRLSVELRYRLDRRKLNGDNRIVVDSIKLGKQIERPGVSRLPLSLAVAVLEDSNGRIDLRLPVSGNLDDPKFSYSGLVWQAFVNVIQKVATAPFRALGAMLGMDGFDEVRFVAGETTVAPPERQKLEQLAQMLTERPQLQLRIAGTYDPVADRAQLARARVDRDILIAAGITLSADEPLPAIDPQDVEMQSAIKSVYAKHVGRLKLIARMVAESGKPDFYAALRQEAIDNEPVSSSDLVALATARAQAALQFLRQSRPALADRLQQAPVKTAHASADGVPLSVELMNH